MTQLNTPYPSTAYITGFLRSRQMHAVQEDLALALILRLLSRTGLSAVVERIAVLPAAARSARVAAFWQRRADYLTTIAPTIAFLQGRDSTLAHRIGSRGFLPEGARFAALEGYAVDSEDPVAWAFGSLGAQDRARHIATLYLNDIADVIKDAIDERFELSAMARDWPPVRPASMAWRRRWPQRQTCWMTGFKRWRWRRCRGTSRPWCC